MIQRIQTVFLLLAIICLGLYLWQPLLIITREGGYLDHGRGWQIGYKTTIGSMGVYTILINAIFSGTAAGFALLNIFLYKFRKAQMLLCWFSVIFTASGLGYVFYQYQTMPSKYDVFAHKLIESDVYLTPWNVLALVAIALFILAFVYIRKDENLIKSLDRLR